MTFHILTIFPKIFDSYLNESILRRAQEKKLIKIKIYNLRDFAKGKHKQVDDKPYGGGPGMVLKVEPIYKAISKLKLQIAKLKKKKTKTLLLSLRGEKFNQKMAREFSELDHLILICGRYEGVDERVAKYIADKEVSIGDYILSGGELPALVIVEAVSRLIPGVLGNIESIEEERMLSFENLDQKSKFKIFSYPVYTRPATFSPKPGILWKVPKVLLSGNHQKILLWRRKHGKWI